MAQQSPAFPQAHSSAHSSLASLAQVPSHTVSQHSLSMAQTQV
jgi:hypothetical protein